MTNFSQKPHMPILNNISASSIHENEKQNEKSKLFSFLSRLFKKNPKKSLPNANSQETITENKRKRGIFSNLFTIFITHKDRMLFLDQLATLLNSDIRIIDALRLIKQQTKKKSFKKLFDLIIYDVEQGLLLSQSMKKYGRVFPEMWISLFNAGEKSGELSKIISDLNIQQEEQRRLVSNIKGALVYPCFIVIMAVSLMVVMMTVFIPRLKTMYAQAHVDLPTITKGIISLSTFVIDNGKLMLIIIIFSVIALIILYRKVAAAKKIIDFINLRWPIFGGINKEKNLIIFADNMSLLLGSGVLIGDALKITSDIVPSINYSGEILRINKEITEGDPMSKSMGLINLQKEIVKHNFYFPIELAQMVSVGERTGNLIPVLKKAKETYSNKVSHTVKNLSTLLEPIMIILVGVMVGFFLLGIMLPFFNLGKVIRGL